MTIPSGLPPRPSFGDKQNQPQGNPQSGLQQIPSVPNQTPQEPNPYDPHNSQQPLPTELQNLPTPQGNPITDQLPNGGLLADEGLPQVPPAVNNVTINHDFFIRTLKRTWKKMVLVLATGITVGIFFQTILYPIIVTVALGFVLLTFFLQGKSKYKPIPVDINNHTITINRQEIPWNQIGWAKISILAGGGTVSYDVKLGTDEKNSTSIPVVGTNFIVDEDEIRALASMLNHMQLPQASHEISKDKILAGRYDLDTFYRQAYAVVTTIAGKQNKS